MLDDPNLRAIFDDVRADYIRDLEACQLDGRPDSDRQALEAVRALQALLAVKRKILQPLADELAKSRNGTA